MANELDGKIRLNGDALVKAYPVHTKLPTVMKTYFERLNKKVEEDNKEIEKANAKLPAAQHKKKIPKNTPCVFQISWALNAMGEDHEIPPRSLRPRDNTNLDGKWHMGAVDELEKHLNARYGPAEVVKTKQRSGQKAMVQYLAGRQGILAFREGFGGTHTEIWDRSRVLQNGAPIAQKDAKQDVAIMDPVWMWKQERIYFWEVIPPGAKKNVPSWLVGWWSISDIGGDYYYFFHSNSTVSYTKVKPKSAYRAVATPDYSGSFTMVSPAGIRILWNKVEYPPEVFYYPPAAVMTAMAGTIEGKASLPFVATRMTSF